LAQFRTTADVLDLILGNGGEVTNGNSAYETQVLNFLNRAHFSILAGGTIPLGKDATVEIDEVWPWARSPRPLILELQPKYDTGTVTLTQGSEAGTFSAGPAASLAGWHIQIEGRPEWFKIASHTAAATAFELDGAYPDTTGASLNFEARKLDYALTPEYIVIDSSNDKLQFQKAASTPLTATLTHGAYTPADLATHAAAVITTAASGPTVTGAYSAITRKFTLTSDLAGATLFQIIGNGTLAEFGAHKVFGFDDETTTSAAAQTSVYALGGIARLIEPMKIHKASGGSLYGIDSESFQRNYPFSQIEEGLPDRFCVVREGADGSLTVRFNRYPIEKTRIEVEYVPVPRDLKDSSASTPIVPRKFLEALEHAATAHLMLLKSDDRAQAYVNLAQGLLVAMISQHRGGLVRTGENFGQITPRADQTYSRRRGLFNSEPH